MEPGGGHLQLTPLAWVAFILAQAGLLARAHARSLATLNRDLAERVALLENKNHEVAALNDELRRQVGDRSARLVEALARIGRLPQREGQLACGEGIGGHYQVKRVLGQGAMGTVYEVVRSTDGGRF